jgi:hypothetical protein
VAPQPVIRLVASALALSVLALPVTTAASAQHSCADQGSAAAAQSARFQDNGDGTVTDARTGLMWMRCSGGQQWQGDRCVGPVASLSLDEAQSEAEQLNRGGAAFFNDWRVPSLRELATITDRRCENPRADLAVFPDTPSSTYWTATPRAGDVKRRWAMSFGGAGVVVAGKDERFHLRLVRTGP